MKIAIMQPYLFPYIGYFQLIAAVDKFVLFDDVNYIKRGWINRNRILVHGKTQLFTVPLQAVSQNKLIKNLSLTHNAKWRYKLIKTLEMAYKKAPEFRTIFPLLTEAIEYEENSLSKYITHSLAQISNYLNISTQLVSSSTVYRNNHLKGVWRIIDICKQEQTTHYINPIGGMSIYSKEQFQEKGIALHFLKTFPCHYPQFTNEFVPSLSIIDVLMFNSKKDIKKMLGAYVLK